MKNNDKAIDHKKISGVATSILKSLDNDYPDLNLFERIAVLNAAAKIISESASAHVLQTIYKAQIAQVISNITGANK